MKNIRQHIRLSPVNVFVFAIKRFLPLMFLICWVLLFSLSPTLAEPDKIVVFFYSSETNINNFKAVKMEFDNYLSTFGDYEFQPFKKKETFEEHIKGKSQCLLLLSSWHYALIHREYGLKPVLVGVWEGQKYQKRILVVTNGAATLDVVKEGQIASASSAQHTRSTLNEMFKGDIAAETFDVLPVPKDIDALMSVGFGMAKSALITENALDILKTVNSPLHKQLKPLAESEESLRLIVAVPEGFEQDAETLLAIFREMHGNPEGERKLKMLGLDGWQTLDSSDEAKLEE